MVEFEGCNMCKYTKTDESSYPCNRCQYNAEDMFEPMTNADQIRDMTNDELASEIESWMCGMQDINCKEDIIEWLEKEVEECVR